MTIFKIVGFGIISVALIIVLKNQKPEMALMCVLASSIILLVFIFDDIVAVFSHCKVKTVPHDKVTIDKNFLKIILKVIGISYIVEFGRNICKDAGENSIANKIEIAGKVIIVSLSIPVILIISSLRSFSG